MEDKATATFTIDRYDKDRAEEILRKLGITPDEALAMYYRQIILKKGIPFQLRLPLYNNTTAEE